MTDIHSCSYHCDRPECIKAQRDKLRERLAQPEQESFSPEAIRATQAAWKMGYDAANAEQSEPEPVALPDQMTPAMLSKVQMHSELGAYAAENLTGAYTLFDEFWRVAISALPPHHNARGKHDQR